MAGTSLLLLIDDIAVVLDDIALMTKVAARKTAAVLGDDLALNAQQVSGVRAERELPVVWAVAKGSALNKLILVPAALLISAVAPWLITPLLMLGGAYLCFEGAEKIIHSLMHKASSSKEGEGRTHAETLRALADPAVDLVAFERDKIKGAIRTDFILSAEIIVIALGTVQDAVLAKQAAVVALIAAVMTVGVYGLVAAIVKLDDAGLYLIENGGKGNWGKVKVAFGRGLLSFAPYLMKTLSVVGTIAMFIVGGSILVHGVPSLHDPFHHLQEMAAQAPLLGAALAAVTPILLDIIVGLLAGTIIVMVLSSGKRIFGGRS